MVEKTVKKQVVELLKNYVAKVAAHVQNTVKVLISHLTQ